MLLAEPPELFLQGMGHTRQVQPLGLAYVGAALAAEHDVRFLLPDTRTYLGDDPWGEIEATIRSEAPDVVGITAVTASYSAAATMAEVVKSVSADIVVVLGGVHASTEPAAALSGAPHVDFVVQGEGEVTMVELLRRGQNGGALAHPETVAGLYWRGPDGDVCRSAQRRPMDDLDALAFPLRTGLVWGDDIHPAFHQGIVTVRGCPYRCIYCAVPSSNDRKTRYRSARNVVDEVAIMRQRHQIPALFFHDSVFTMRRSRTVELCDALIQREMVVPFHCQTRADRVDAELLQHMKTAGCEQIFFGIESGDADSLLHIRKKMDLNTIREAVAMVKDLGIRCTGFFMVGFPWETEAHMRRTIEFATTLDLDAVSLFSATPLPGTELWDMAGGDHMPASVDFRTPQVNVTHLPDEAYSELFAGFSGEIAEYNLAQMGTRAAMMQGQAPLSWLD